jgi:glycosyltransferase involved in cell wall biosynthesis
MTILYITFDGVTDHIGRSQVAPYVLGLARLGFKIHILSAEKSGREELVGRYRRLFEDAAIGWTRVDYSNRPQVVGQALTVFRMRRSARRIAQAERVRLMHCRCFPPSLIGWDLKRTRGTRFLYDFRDFYADNILVKSRGLKTMLGLGFKRLEGPMIRAADKIVCLTERAAAILAEQYLNDDPRARQRCQVIPCCADFSHFNRTRLTAADVSRAREKAGLRDNDFVLLYLGSLGPDYLLGQMMALFAQLLTARPNAKFLFLSNNGRELVEAARVARGVPTECVSFASADRDDVPAFLAIADMSVVFIRADVSKAGCSPTKLAELFACDVPVIANAGVGDMDRIIDPRCNGSVLVKNFSDETLRTAVEVVLAHKGTTNIRENSREFDVQEGIARYAAVYSELLHQ